ncbi:hypothetical protein KUTeg_020346 [Tegillarca granosa]|uniref:DDE-1 domain-containing protein n=1 Tax=Tegillarca granosa TaxID=220873 RepID=A0ABQ9E7N7_TEGGR|nr:hypothetical protein KUTeg_020346 [Tegillarca granosa]
MAAYGCDYTLQECTDIATEFAIQLGERTADKSLTMKWMRGFRARWPDIQKFSPRALEYTRAKMIKKIIVMEYFDKFEQSLKRHGLIDKPHLIFNIDEKGMSVDHKPPHVMASAGYCPPAVTSGKGKTVTLLGCGSVSGVAIPAYYVFPDKRINSDLLEGASPCTSGTVSETGWSNSKGFRTYLQTHFLKYAPGRNGEKIMLIMDGYGSHLSVSLVDWARSLNIVLFSCFGPFERMYKFKCHQSFARPLDVSSYGPFERMYNFKCHQVMRETTVQITRYNIC